VLSANELSSFIVYSFWNNDTQFTRCAQESNVYSACSLDAFSFGPKGNLAFTVRRNGGDGFGAGWYGGIQIAIWEQSTPTPRPATQRPATTPSGGYGPTRPDWSFR
jgi:hypothetical protein